MIIVGIDPGLSGGICVMDQTGYAWVVDMPTHTLVRGGKTKREIDAHALVQALPILIEHVFVERQGGRPGQNISGVGSMMMGYGIILGVLAARGVPYTIVHPQVWKKALGVPKAKDGARARASQLIPEAAERWSRVKDDGRAEAALIAYYGRRYLDGIAGGQAA